MGTLSRKTVLAVLVAVGGLFHLAAAVEPPRGEVFRDETPRLQALLRAWEKANAGLRQAHYELEWTGVDPVFQETTKCYGEAFVKKPDLLRVTWKDAKGQLTDIFFWAGNVARWFSFKDRTERVFELPPGYPESVADRDSWAGVIARAAQEMKWRYLGFPIEDLKKRYRLRLLKEDDAWAYIEGEPRPQDGRCFHSDRIQVVLNRQTHRVGRVSVEGGTGRSSTWDFKKATINAAVPVTAEALAKDLPERWNRVALSLSDGLGLRLSDAPSK
jgi:hypothetical protein